MEMTSPMQSKPLVNATCKLGKNGCYEDGRCHYIGNCVSKIETNADRIRAMTDEELCRFLRKWVNDELWARDWGERLWWLQQPCEGSPTVEKGKDRIWLNTLN